MLSVGIKNHSKSAAGMDDSKKIYKQLELVVADLNKNRPKNKEVKAESAAAKKAGVKYPGRIYNHADDDDDEKPKKKSKKSGVVSDGSSKKSDGAMTDMLFH